MMMMMQPSDEIKQLENENRKLTNEIDELKEKSTKQEVGRLLHGSSKCPASVILFPWQQ